MEKINDGGPAFPAPDFIVDTAKLKEDGFQRMGMIQGMSLRDYFAGQALAGFLACYDFLIVAKENQTYEEASAEKAYEYADALLKARSK